MRAKKGSGIGRGSKVAREWAKNVKLRDEKITVPAKANCRSERLM